MNAWRVLHTTSSSNQLFKAQEETHKRSEDAEMCTQFANLKDFYCRVWF